MNSLTPEQIQQLMALSTMDEEGTDIDNQIAQAQALAQPTSGHHRTGMAAAIGGIGDIFRVIGGGIANNKAQDKKADLHARRLAARNLFAQQMYGNGAVPGAADPGGGPQMNPQEATLLNYDAQRPMGPETADQPYGAGPYGYTPGGS